MAYSTIRNGSKGSDVKTWQNHLKSQGYDIGSSGADGIFGSATAAATKKYQKDKGLTVDGIVGSNTWASMNTGSKNNTNTKTTTTNTSKETTTKAPDGISQTTWETANSKWEGSKELGDLETDKNKYKDTAMDFYSNTNIVDEETKNKMNGQLGDYLSPEIAQADAWLKGQLAQIQSGKTSWTDQYNNAINEYLNREDFEYDVDNDQLFQQALASAMNSGKSAMQDTIGQASALTGGYGSTYATTAGNQAYNQFIEDAYDNLPEYYQMALEAYQMEGQEMLNRVDVLGAADDKEYGRMVDAYSLTSDYSNTLWDRGYNEWATTTGNAINYGNFLLNENSTIASNLMGAYDISANEYEMKYTEEFNEWNTAVQNAWNAAGIEQGAYQFGVQQDNWEKEYALSEKQYRVSTGDTNGDGVLSASEKAAANTTYTYDSKGNPVKSNTSDGSDYNLPKSDIDECKEILKNGGTIEDVEAYLKGRGLAPQNETEADILNNAIGYTDGNTSSNETSKDITKWSVDDWKNTTFTKVEDTINWFWGDDDDEVIVNGTVYSINDVRKMMKDAGMDDKTATVIYDKLKDLDTDATYSFISKNSK